LVGEIVMTAVLVLAVFATIDSGRKEPWFGPFAIGMAVFCGHLMLIPVTNCSINPARSFGTVLYSNNDNGAWEDFWIFLVGPAVGAVISAMVYPAVFSHAMVESDKEDVDVSPDSKHNNIHNAKTHETLSEERSHV